METNKKLRLIILLQLVAIVLLIGRIVWEEVRPAGRDAIGQEKSESSSQEESLLSITSLPDQVFSTPTVLSDTIPLRKAIAMTKRYRKFFSKFSRTGSARENLYRFFHGQEPSTDTGSVVSYHIQGDHLKDLLNQSSGADAANVVVIFPAFRRVPSDDPGDRIRPEYTFVIAAGVKNTAGKIKIIKTRTARRTKDGGEDTNVIYDELGTCPSPCNGFDQ